MKPVRLESLDHEEDGRRYSPSAARNRDQILGAFREVCPPDARVLEIASGTGEHAVHFASALPSVTWQPTDRNAEALQSIEAWRVHSAIERIDAPIDLDVGGTWPSSQYDVVFVSNFFHITAWEACCAFLIGASKALVPSGIVFIYGAFFRDGVDPAPSNLDFDRNLREKDPGYGVRRLEDVCAVAEQHGLSLLEARDMPNNNYSVILSRQES